MIDLKPLLIEYVPPKAPYRERQLSTLVGFLNNDSNYSNLIILRGASGLGKTLLLKKTMISCQKFEKICSYISVHRFSSYEQILREICYKINLIHLTSHISINNVLYNIKRRVSYSSSNKLILFFDDCLNMLDLMKITKLLKCLTDSNINMTCFISTKIKSIKLIEMLREMNCINEKYLIDLPRYSMKELKDIFMYRFSLTNCPVSFLDEQLFNYLAEIVYKYFYSNVSVGLAVLYEILQRVINKNCMEISLQDIDNLLKNYFNPI